MVKDIRKETDECVSIAFDIPAELKDDFHFIQGQNVTIKMEIDGEEIRRSYSICSTPYDNELRIAVKKVENGAFSTFANQKLKKGDLLDVLPPTGCFYTALNKAAKKNYSFFAAGSGITPVISIVKTILLTEPESSVVLIYGNRTVSSIIFKEQLEALKDKYINRFSIFYILSRERTDNEINFGRIDAGKCLQFSKLIDYDSVNEFFICGPEQMIYSVKDFLEAGGISKNKIHFELFTTPKRLIETKFVSGERDSGNGSEITIKSDGRSFSFMLDPKSNNILDAAISRGMDLPFSCKGGVCCTCKSKLTEGEVEMETNYGLEPEEVKAGFVLTCQSHPVSKKVVLDFDLRI